MSMPEDRTNIRLQNWLIIKKIKTERVMVEEDMLRLKVVH